VGWLADRFNYKIIMQSSLVISAIILLNMLFVSSPTAVATVIFIYAFTADIFRPANAKAIAVSSTPENRTRSVALVRLAVNLGFTLGPALGGLIAHYFSYHVLFVIDAITSLLAAGYLYYSLKHEKINVEKIKLTPAFPSKVISAYSDYWYLFFIFLCGCYATSFFQLFASIPQYFRTVNHYTDDKIGYLLALNGILVVLIEMPFVSYFENRIKVFNFITIGVLFIPAAFMFLVLGHQSILFALIYTLVITLSEIFAMPFMMNITLSRAHPQRHGQYSALYSIAFGAGTIFAPAIGLGIADRYGFDNMFYFFMLMSAGTAAAFLWLKGKMVLKEN
jgi:predicted MFS family arabinose efflux permease